MRTLIFLLLTSVARAQPTVDSNGVVVPFAAPTSKQVSMIREMGPQIPNGSNPWNYGDYGEFGCRSTPNCVPVKHGIATSVLNAALANPPVLGAELTGSGSCTFTDGPTQLTCPGANFTVEAPGRYDGLAGNVTCVNFSCTANSGSAFVSGFIGNIFITVLGVPYYPSAVADATHLTLASTVGSTPITTDWSYAGSCLVVATNSVSLGINGAGRYSDLVYSSSATTVGFLTYQTGISSPGSAIHVYKCPTPSATFSNNWWNLTGAGGNTNWNYYDAVIAAYRDGIRTAAQDVCGTYCTQARQLADLWFLWSNNNGDGTAGLSPRVAALSGLFVRALDGKPEYFPGLYNIVANYITSLDLDPNNYSPAHIHDWRETGYVQRFIADGAISDRTANGGSDTRHTQYCSWLATRTPGFLKTTANGGFLTTTGTLLEPIYNWNQDFPFLDTATGGQSPWRFNIAIHALMKTYEVLKDTTAAGCNNIALAAQLLPVIQGMVDWVFKYGYSDPALGGNGFIYYDVGYETNGIGPDWIKNFGRFGPAHGTVTLTIGSTTIVGTGTSFLTDFNCNGTDYYASADYGLATFNYQGIYKVLSCPDNTHMTISFPFGHYGESINAINVGVYYEVSKSWTGTQCASLANYCNQDNQSKALDIPPGGNGGAVRDTPGAQGWMSYNCVPQPSCRATYIARGDELMARFLRGPGNGPYGSTACVGPGGLCYPGPPDGWVQSLDGGGCGSGCGDGPYSNNAKGWAQGSGVNNYGSHLAYRLMNPNPPPPTSRISGKIIIFGVITIR